MSTSASLPRGGFAEVLLSQVTVISYGFEMFNTLTVGEEKMTLAEVWWSRRRRREKRRTREEEGEEEEGDVTWW